jgi:8-oxo-dGTP diphosphatase
MENIPKVGVGVMIWKDHKILLGKRKNAHGEGQYAFPGGHFEYMESFEDCARREVREEVGIELDNIKFQLLGNITDFAPKHYVQVSFTAEWKSGDVKVLEPEKCEGWEWFELDKLPDNIMITSRLSIESYKNGQIYFPSTDGLS